MPDLLSIRRRSRNHAEDDEAEQDSSDNEVHSRRSSRKRLRLSDENEGTPSTVGTPVTNAYRSPPATLHQETLRSEVAGNEHQPGSIVRVKLENFVTYSAVEFFPGPSLNMVIGPNGTGKSTLVCAICIGLGWPPGTMGRAKDAADFVKHGKREATIEIELATDGKVYKKNIVIRCTIKREGSKTVFSVNGKPEPKKKVLAVARSLSIQIDNLCQFLPQDRVVEFAGMTPIELLQSTEAAVASQEMIDMHEELKRLRKEQKILQSKADQDQDQLTGLEARQRLQEADVERMRERESVVKRIEMLEHARPAVHYRMAKNATVLAKNNRRTAQREFDRLSTETGPALEAVNKKQRYVRGIEAVVKDRKAAVTGAVNVVERIDRQIEISHENHKSEEQAITAEKDATRRQKGEIANMERKIKEWELQLQNAPPDVDVAAYNEQIRSKQRAWEQASRHIEENKRRQQELVGMGRDKGQQINNLEHNLAQLESQAGKQGMKLQKLSRETGQLWQWVQQHQTEFEQHVYGPPVVECAIKDPRYIDLVESLFQRGNWLSFTAQSYNDFKKLSDIAHDRLGLSEVNIRQVTYGLDRFRPCCGEEEMRRYGFEGWALDLINGPDPVLAMLCGEVKLHETGVSMRDTTPQQFQLIQNSPVQTWVTSKTFYRITRRREYGPDATSTQTRSLRKATVWTDQPVDLTAKREIQERIDELKDQIEVFKGEVEELKTNNLQQQNIYLDNKEEAKLLQDEKSTKQKAQQEFKAIPAKISTNEDKLATKREQLSTSSKRLRQHSDKQDALAVERARLSLSFADAVNTLQKAHLSLLEVEIMLIEAVSDFQILDDRNAEVRELMKAKQDELEELDRETSRTREQAQLWLRQLQELLAGDGENGPLRAFFGELGNEITIEELEADITSEQARLELMHEGNGNTIREFEQRRKKIDSLTAKLGETKEFLEAIQQKTDELRENWEPEMDRLIGRISDSFSYNMEQINCAGEVGIWKDDEFDQWSIQIKVKFREHEDLSPLNAHRQSGGERAVSTIFYLMSLQSLTPCPFRVVDEINQGMDPRNERLVHKRMVDIACGTAAAGPNGAQGHNGINGNDDSDQEDEGQDSVQAGGRPNGSQYFLITPKLLHDLSYARGMRVLCIASGEYMPDESKSDGASVVDFKACVSRMRDITGYGGEDDVSGSGGYEGVMDGGRTNGRIGVAAG